LKRFQRQSKYLKANKKEGRMTKEIRIKKNWENTDLFNEKFKILIYFEIIVYKLCVNI
jgi:hypothetical protein